ncbi:MAG: ABC transporter substrate-binding protein, partial [Clostridia bacterium]|nr:ABC transporter substrate-binding protein [Clostridia bacterium]
MKKFLAVLLACAALCGCAAAKDEIVISTGVNMVAGKFDPTTGHGVWGPDIFHCHLVKVGADNKLELDLATSEKVGEGGAVYTYEIRKDAKFTDGVPLTAKDVVFTFET